MSVPTPQEWRDLQARLDRIEKRLAATADSIPPDYGTASAARRGLMSREQAAKLDSLVAPQAPATDANGWLVDRQENGKARYRRRYVNQAMPAAAEAVLVSGIPLPAGFAAAGQLDRFFTWTSIDAGSAGVAPQRYVIVLRAAESSATLDIMGWSPGGAALNAYMGTANFFIELVER